MSHMPKSRQGIVLLQSRLLQEELGRSVAGHLPCPHAVKQTEGCGILISTQQSTHKTIHKAQNSMLSKIITPSVISLPDADGHFNPFPAYPFTGSLRPVYPLSPRRTVPDRIKLPDYAGNGIPKSEQVCAWRERIGDGMWDND